MIDMLPDNALLDIFDFYKDDPGNCFEGTWGWKLLTQVCRRWRHVIFGSPRRLDLRLVCGPTTPTKKLLDIWPLFPITVTCLPSHTQVDGNSLENLIAAFECRDRTSQIYIHHINGPALEKVVAVMNEPFPILTDLWLSSMKNEAGPVLPETFLGGSAPSLRSFILAGIPFPAFPKFILSATQIVRLYLYHIGYISPEVMTTCLATLPSLDYLFLGFRSFPYIPVEKGPPPLTRAVLPTLTRLSFLLFSEYFEAFVARVDTPLLKRLYLSLSSHNFDIPQFHNFVDRIESLGPSNQAEMEISYGDIKMNLGSPTRFELDVGCPILYSLDWQLSSMTQIFGQQLRLLSHVERLEIREAPWGIHEPVINSSLWLELFRLFIAVHSLYVSEKLVATVAAVLKELTVETVMEVFPVLYNLYLEGLQSSGSVQDLINPFVASRQLSGHPVVIQSWERQPSIDD